MKSTRSTFLLLSKVLLAFTIIGLFLPFVNEAMWAGFYGDEANTAFEYFTMSVKYGVLKCLLICAILSIVSILYTYVNFRRSGRDLNSESTAVDYLFVVIAIYAFSVPSAFLLGERGYAPNIGFVFMLVALIGSLIFLIAASMQEKTQATEDEQVKKELAIFLLTPIVILFSGIFILLFQIEYGPLEIFSTILTVVWIYGMQSYYAKRDKFPLKTKYIIILLIANIIFSLMSFIYRYQQIDLYIFQGWLFGNFRSVFISEVILLLPLAVNKVWADKSK